MPNPSAVVEIGFGSAWDAASPTWTDVTQYVRELDVERGRPSDLDPFDIGTAYVKLDNRDGRFNPTNTASPYYPNVKPRKQIRIRGLYSTTTRTNLCTNPSFETDTTGWGVGASTTLARVTSDSYIGGASLQMTANSAVDTTARIRPNPEYSATAGVTYSASAYVKTTAGNNRNIQIALSFHNSVGTTLLLTGGTITPFTVGGAWTRLEVTATAPTNTVGVRIFIYHQLTNPSVSNVALVDAILLEESATVGDYFDGSTSPLCSWTGTVNNSTSVEQSTYFPVYRGYIQEWPQEYPETGKDATVNISCVDALSILGGTEVAVDELTARVQAGELPAPLLRYKLGDSPSDVPQFTDASGNNKHLKASGTIETQQPLARQLGPSSAFDFFTAGDSVQQATTGTSWSVSFWIQTVGSVAGKKEMIFTSAVAEDQQPTVYYMDSSGYLQCDTYDYIPGPRGQVKTTVAVNDGVPHHIVFTHSSGTHKVYVDNIDRTNLLAGASGEFAGQVTLAKPPVTTKSEGSESYFYGWLSEVCLFNDALTATQVGYLFGFGTGTNMVELTSARMTRLINSAWSTAPKTIDTGQAICAWSEWGDNALSACQKVAATENSYFFADRSGTLTFRNRYYPKQNSLAKTSQATFGDDTGIGYTGLTFRYGTDDIVNTVKVNAGGGIDQTSTKTSSVTAYGNRATTIDSLLSPVDALSMAQGIANQYAEPVLRAQPFQINLATGLKTVAPFVLNLELGYGITLRRNANGVTAPIVQFLNVTGINHTVTPDTWTVTLQGTPRDAYTYFVLDTSTLDGTDVLGY